MPGGKLELDVELDGNGVDPTAVTTLVTPIGIDWFISVTGGGGGSCCLGEFGLVSLKISKRLVTRPLLFPASDNQ
jgi:hypothetical protein